jgi:protease II
MQVGSVETSPNNKMLAWTEDTSGNEKYTLNVKVEGFHVDMTAEPQIYYAV